MKTIVIVVKKKIARHIIFRTKNCYEKYDRRKSDKNSMPLPYVDVFANLNFRL